MREAVLQIGGRDPLVGIVTVPDESIWDQSLPAVLLLNSGMVHRVGPGRLYVKLARMLASRGFLVFRFDLSGIGDSSPRRGDQRPLGERWPSEVREAMDRLEKDYGIDRFGLTGICMGAKISYLTARVDRRVVGAALINSQDHLHDSMNEALDTAFRDRASARHNVRLAFSTSMSLLKWRKVLSGRVNLRSVTRLLGIQLAQNFRGVGSNSEATEIVSQLDSLRNRGTKILHIYSEGDLGLDYLHVVLGEQLESSQTNGTLNLITIPGANHTFTLLEKQAELLGSLCEWANSLATPGSFGRKSTMNSGRRRLWTDDSN